LPHRRRKPLRRRNRVHPLRIARVTLTNLLVMTYKSIPERWIWARLLLNYQME